MVSDPKRRFLDTADLSLGSLMMGQGSRSKVKVKFKVKVRGQGHDSRQRGKIGPKKAVLKRFRKIGPLNRRFLDTADLS